MRLIIFNEVSDVDKNVAVQKLIENSTPRADFFFFVVLSVAMATLGIMVGSVPVIIGSMLIAPMLYPILAVGMGISISDKVLMKRSLLTFIQAIGLALLASFFVAVFFVGRGNLVALSIIVQTKAGLIDVGIAIVAGVAASLALAKPQLNESLPGVAISAALVPPLSVVGIGLASFKWELARSSLVLFLISSLGIIVSSLVIFAFLNFHGKKPLIHKVIKEEDKEVKVS